jgi:hypothetical protein
VEDRRVFSEQEVTAVVRRAVELQESASKESYQPGVTPDELTRIAGELGIEPKYLQQAIAEANSLESKKGPLNLTEEFERVVDTELSPDDYDVLLKYLKPTHRHTIAQVGKTLSGRTWTGCSFANVEVTAKKGRTRVNVKSNPLFAWLVTLHPATIATFIILGAMGDAGLLWPAIGICSIIWLIAGFAFKTLLAKGHKAAKRLTDNLANAVAETAPDLRQNLANAPAATQSDSETVQTTA